MTRVYGSQRFDAVRYSPLLHLWNLEKLYTADNRLVTHYGVQYIVESTFLLMETMSDFVFYPVTTESFSDLADFFEQYGNPNYCWCMRWRLKSVEFREINSKERQSKLESLIQSNVPVGVAGYHQGKVVGWCSIAPRETYPLLERSTILKRIDNLPVWSVVCFFVAPNFRGQNLSVKLLRSAVTYAISEGASVIEGYPVEPDKSYRFMGSPAIFEQAGFEEVGTAKNGRSIVRFYADGSR